MKIVARDIPPRAAWALEQAGVHPLLARLYAARGITARDELDDGLAVKYDPSALIGAATHQALAKGQEIGRRFHSAPVVRLSDARPMQLGHAAEADARWRIYAFAGKADGSAPGSAIHKLADWLERDPKSPVVRHTRKDEDIDTVIDFRAVFQQTFDQLACEQMPSLLRPKTGRLGLQDHEKVFCADHKKAGDIFDMRGIDRNAGCMVVVRPDQYVAHVLPLDAFDETTLRTELSRLVDAEVLYERGAAPACCAATRRSGRPRPGALSRPITSGRAPCRRPRRRPSAKAPRSRASFASSRRTWSSPAAWR